jgi:parallel beta-helix repeat protein
MKNTIESNITNSQVIRDGIHLSKDQLVIPSKNNNVSNNDATSESMGILVRGNSDGNTLEG